MCVVIWYLQKQAHFLQTFGLEKFCHCSLTNTSVVNLDQRKTVTRLSHRVSTFAYNMMHSMVNTYFCQKNYIAIYYGCAEQCYASINVNSKITDHMSKGGNAIASLCPSIHLFPVYLLNRLTVDLLHVSRSQS